jgi:RNA polymerase sigma-70 factor (ECF subfamily)
MVQQANIQDGQIVSLMKDHPRRAIALVLEKYGGALLWAIKKVVHSEEVAQDILQDACVKIWKNAHRYDPEKGELFTWLVRVARNLAIDKVRTKKFQARQTSKKVEDVVTDNINYSEEMNPEDTGLRNQINKLDPKYRQIIELLYFQGYTQREITSEFDIPLGTVKTRARKAITELRKLLKENLTIGPFWIASIQAITDFFKHLN